MPCARGYRVVYHNMPKLSPRLKMSKADGSYLKEIARIERQQLLILDDFGLQPLDAPSRTALMELVEDRHGKSSLIITSQVPVSKWYDIVGEQTNADAILDRIVHNAHRLELKGGSLRKKKSGRSRTDKVILSQVNSKSTSIFMNRLNRHELKIFASKTGGQFAPA